MTRISKLATKHISDALVCAAFQAAKGANFSRYPYDFLMEETKAPFKVCYRAMERAERNGLVDYGVSLRTGWLTDKGILLLLSHSTRNPD
jgi:hypothetical protein